MTRVVFPDHLLQYTGGVRELDVIAGNVRELLLILEERFPGCQEALARSAIAIEGQIHQDAYLESVPADGEVFFMQRIEGG
jgi:hypothetical protein